MAKRKSVVTENDFVECPYCPKGDSNKFKLLHWNHLKKLHNKTLDDVIKEFPGLPTITKTEYDKKINSAKIGGDKSKETQCRLKTIKCIHCKKELQVPNNHSNKIACEECLNKGLENPDGRTKESANINRVKTIREKYNRDNVQQIKEVREKTSKTNDKRYGGTGFASDELAEKSRNTTDELYGNINIMKTDHGKSFFTGDVNPMKREEVKKKVSDSLKGRESKLKGRTYEEIHGKEKADELKEERRRIFIEKFKPELDKFLNFAGIDLLDDYYGCMKYYNFKCRTCGTVFKDSWFEIYRNDHKNTCPKCFPKNKGFSKGEKEVAKFVKSLGFDILENDKKIIKPKELDIVIPSKNIAIEYNGLTIHSTLNPYKKPGEKYNPKYHLNKTLECLKNKYRLIHIFEDEWIFKKDIVQRRLKNILNIHESQCIFARKCIISPIDYETKSKFLNEYHLQGNDISNINLGAFYNNELIAVMTFSHGSISKGSKYTEKVFELSRYCCSCNNAGIASKLLSHFKNNYEWEMIFTYCDRRWSSGKFYELIGFEKIGNTEITKYYTNGLVRIHRFAFKSRNISENKHISDMLFDEPKYGETHDCGHFKFIIRKGEN